jgi:anion-transporting  ArsA/GET3 family ATPase
VDARCQELLTRPVQFFTGKGGVGKSSVLGGLAMSAARAQKRPLIVELGIHTSSSHLFHGPNVGYEPSEVAPGVFATRVLFEPALVDYITSRLKLRFVATLVARNATLKKLFMAAPGVDEIVTLHRVAQLADDPQWGPVLVDLESTGHALMFFDLPSVLEVFLMDGPLRQVLDGATRLVRDPKRAAVHVVTVPEGLAVNETIQLFRALRGRDDLHLGCLCINRVPKVWLDDDERSLVERELETTAVDAPWYGDLALARYFAKRSDIAAKCLRGLEHDIDLPTVQLEASDAEGPGIVEALADAFDREGLW